MEPITKEKSFNDWIREFYNNDKQQAAKGNYEYFRWFSSEKKRRQYQQTTRSLNYHLSNTTFKNCLDIGCGPGTWTFLLLKRFPQANFTCLDISKEMLSQFQSRINSPRIEFVISAFSDFPLNKKYDFLFSSRSIEYMENKPLVIKKMYDALESGGKGMIVTSPPHEIYTKVKKILGKKENLQHTKRIFIREMYYLLKNAGFKNIRTYPILFADQLPESLNHLLFDNLYKKKWNLLSTLFASGYIVKFDKP
jgi:ubiquinone/menaquinone biosynthesis C-methylase UbiE